MIVKFLSDLSIECNAGQVVDLPPQFATKLVSLGVAEEVERTERATTPEPALETRKAPRCG